MTLDPYDILNEGSFVDSNSGLIDSGLTSKESIGLLEGVVSSVNSSSETVICKTGDNPLVCHDALRTSDGMGFSRVTVSSSISVV